MHQFYDGGYAMCGAKTWGMCQLLHGLQFKPVTWVTVIEDSGALGGSKFSRLGFYLTGARLVTRV